MKVTYETQYSHVLEDAINLMEYIKNLNGDLTDEKKKELGFRAALRLIRLNQELESISRFLSMKESENDDE